ncbi:MAG: class II fructose-bisphosphate aldolase [Planctomycetaceae bacterium]|nr:class II fructose-bisphosphate aldolase [Planctomycetaceae bacterium]
MPLPTTRELVRNAWKKGLVVPAYNIPYLPMLEPVVRAIRDTGSFGLIQVARLEIFKFDAGSYRAVRDEYEKYKDSRHTRLHLDYLPVIDEDGVRVDYLREIGECLDLGYESVMVDGSRLSLHDNIDATRQVVQLAHGRDVPVEGELGAVIGHEAGPMMPYEELFATGKGFTDPAEAERFVRESGVDWLSVAIGNFHGAVAPDRKDAKKIAARLNIRHLAAINAAAGVPLVLHGGSGITKEYLQEAFRNGIAKINIATNIRQPYEQAVGESPEKAVEATYRATREVIEHDLDLVGLAAKLEA